MRKETKIGRLADDLAVLELVIKKGLEALRSIMWHANDEVSCQHSIFFVARAFNTGSHLQAHKETEGRY